jgi:hypothetical protein
MPDRLSRRTTLLLAAVAFGLTFAVQMLLGAGSSAEAPASRPSSPPIAADARAAESDLRLAAAGSVPPLRDPRSRRAPARKPKRAARKRTQAAPAVRPAPIRPAATRQPAPAATPHSTPTPPTRSVPAPKPKPKATPAPTAKPPLSGEFDTSGEP